MKRIALPTFFFVVFANISYSQVDEAKSLTFTPYGNSGVSNIISNLSLSSTFNAGQNAKAELKYTTEKWETYGLTVDQKINEGTKKATPLDLLNGIASGTKIGINFQKMYWDPQLSLNKAQLFDRAADSYSSRTNVDRGTVTRNEILKNGTDEEKRFLKGFATKSPIFFNIQGFLEQTSFSFSTDSISLSEQNVNYMTPSASASVMFPSIAKSSMWVLSYSYAENYAEGSAVSFSSPFGSTSNYVNKDITFGRPVKSYNHKATIEYRKGFLSNDQLSVVINPALSWGSVNNLISLTLPIYFIQAANTDENVRGLQGGFTVGYSGFNTDSKKFTSFSDGFGAQLFITAPFNIFGDL
ncbi:MAG TPA: hypothetical protein VK658_07035 [Chryseolinea sp.]|nr:hypothetical protein [Chryseolinea sp.]